MFVFRAGDIFCPVSPLVLAGQFTIIFCVVVEFCTRTSTGSIRTCKLDSRIKRRDGKAT